MSSQVGFPTGVNYEIFKSLMAVEVCQNVEIAIKKCTKTSKNWLGREKQEFDSAKFKAFYYKDADNLRLAIEQLTPTEKKAYDIILKASISFFNTNKYCQQYIPKITSAEQIEDLRSSKAIQISSMATLQGAVLNRSEYSHFCDAQHAKLWV